MAGVRRPGRISFGSSPVTDLGHFPNSPQFRNYTRSPESNVSRAHSQVNCQIKTQAYYYFKFMWKVQRTPGLLLFVALSLNAGAPLSADAIIKSLMQTFVGEQTRTTRSISPRLVWHRVIRPGDMQMKAQKSI
jgi:hypothetical protein